MLGAQPAGTGDRNTSIATVATCMPPHVLSAVAHAWPHLWGAAGAQAAAGAPLAGRGATSAATAAGAAGAAERLKDAEA